MYQDLEPKAVFRWFYELNQIPRGSGNEQAASDFLVRFAKERGLEYEQDAAMNVIIRKAASKGYEQATPVILQGHMDMVCEKTADSPHDFLKDPIEMIVEGDTLRANKTTLGGDDGIAIAYGLAILDDDSLQHPALEVLCTTAEETGMDGAIAIREGQLKGKRLLNIDSEEEGIFLVACAGGADASFELAAAPEMLPAAQKALKVEISGLLGGHSGMQIKLGRANALKVLTRLLQVVKKAQPELRLGCMSGGSKHNAIPTAAHACFLCSDLVSARQALEKATAEIKQEFRTVDPDLAVSISEVERDKAFSQGDSARILDLLTLIPHGVLVMSADIEGLVETSINVAILKAVDDKLLLSTSVRSSSMSARAAFLDRLQVLADRLGSKLTISSGYPAWEFKADSPLRDRALRVYETCFGEKATYTAIHAGLECALLSKVMPDCDMISFGPNLYDVHTPKEHASISSVARMYEFTKALLAELKD